MPFFKKFLFVSQIFSLLVSCTVNISNGSSVPSLDDDSISLTWKDVDSTNIEIVTVDKKGFKGICLNSRKGVVFSTSLEGTNYRTIILSKNAEKHLFKEKVSCISTSFVYDNDYVSIDSSDVNEFIDSNERYVISVLSRKTGNKVTSVSIKGVNVDIRGKNSIGKIVFAEKEPKSPATENWRYDLKIIDTEKGMCDILDVIQQSENLSNPVFFPESIDWIDENTISCVFVKIGKDENMTGQVYVYDLLNKTKELLISFPLDSIDIISLDLRHHVKGNDVFFIIDNKLFKSTKSNSLPVLIYEDESKDVIDFNFDTVRNE